MIRKIALEPLMLSTAKDDASVRHRDLIVGLIVDRLVRRARSLDLSGRSMARAPTPAWRGARAWQGRRARGLRGARLAADPAGAHQNGLARRHLKADHWCCTMSALPIWKDVIVRWPAMAIADHRGDRPQIVYGLLCTREGWRWRGGVRGQ